MAHMREKESTNVWSKSNKYQSLKWRWWSVMLVLDFFVLLPQLLTSGVQWWCTAYLKGSASARGLAGGQKFRCPVCSVQLKIVHLHTAQRLWHQGVHSLRHRGSVVACATYKWEIAGSIPGCAECAPTLLLGKALCSHMHSLDPGVSGYLVGQWRLPCWNS